jgi:hypothetical protein
MALDFIRPSISVVMFLASIRGIFKQSVHRRIFIVLCMLNLDLFKNLNFTLANEIHELCQVTFLKDHMASLAGNRLEVLTYVLFFLLWESIVVELRYDSNKGTLRGEMTFVLSFVNTLIVITVDLEVPAFSKRYSIKELEASILEV